MKTESSKLDINSSAVRVRLAPSPTGKLHIGVARTALFNYLFAKKYNGTFVLRIEDTDRDRSSEVYTKDILESLLWLGLDWDEGPEVGGPFGPYFQQERLDIYREYTEKLLREGKAYRCFCNAEELEVERRRQQERGELPRYSGRCRYLTKQEIDQFEREGRAFVIRFKTEEKVISFDDLIRGKVEIDAGLFGDFVIIRSDGTPLFLFSNVVDDNLMKISHVLRGEDHVNNTAKQILIAESLNFLSPQFGHLPLIFNKDRSKMSKRKDPVSISQDFRAKGFLPEAMVNFMALLGWSSGTDREIFSLKELIDEFQIERVGRSPSIFDYDKLLWMNGYYIRQLTVGDLASRAVLFLKDKAIIKASRDDTDYFLQAVSLVQERLKVLSEVEELIWFFFHEPKYEPRLLIAKKSTKARTLKALKATLDALPKIKNLCFDDCELVLRQTARDNNLKDGELLWAVRVALTGRDASPGTFELLEVLGPERSLKRLQAAIKKLAA